MSTGKKKTRRKKINRKVTPRSPADIILALEEANPEAILYEGFNDALIGIIARCATEPLAVYDRALCIEVLMREGATHEEAEDYFCYNVEGCWAGPGTPFIASFDLDALGTRYPVVELKITGEDVEVLIGEVGEVSEDASV